MRKGVTVWFTGLSGAGKTTISKMVESSLRKSDLKVEVLDGDAVRQHLTSDLGFSKADRQKNIERVAFVSKLLARNGVITLASFITPYKEMRDFCRREIGSYVEIYVKCPLEECIRRDVKGLYKKALDGEIQQFTGISDPFEEPDRPELVLDTTEDSKEICAAKVLDYLIRHSYISGCRP
jgi:adenylylsulfate kinase